MRWKEIAKTRDSVTKVHLEGMSDRRVAELASLARSWESPARMTIESAGYSGGDYDPGERAWIVERSATAATEPLALTLAASRASPVENVALVVKGWGDDRPRRLRDRARHRAAPAGPRAPLSRPGALDVLEEHLGPLAL